ncbi:MAG: GH39 family glycosyl hydrolase [Ferrimicrobium sp.]
MTDAFDARTDWEHRIYERSDVDHNDVVLLAPSEIVADPGFGCILLTWEEVVGAIGYVIECTGKDGVPTVLRHGGSDVAAVPGLSFVVTGVEDGIEYLFRVAAVATAGAQTGNWSQEVRCATKVGSPLAVEVGVDAATVIGNVNPVWKMIGSERLSQLSMGMDEHGHDIGREFLEALRIAHDDLGVRWVRAHAILHDDLGVVKRDETNQLVFNFESIDKIFDQILAIGVRPVVELSFMPEAIASDPSKTVFTYRGIVSPPAEWAEWALVVKTFAQHLVDRYGIDEVVRWPFEVWNEPNLEVFWSSTSDDYLRLYDESARALKSVDTRLQVGGPSSAADEWVEMLAAHARNTDTPLDFVSTHTYGNLPLDFRSSLARHGFENLPIYWTEWGVGSTHFGPVHDSVAGASFILSGYATVNGRLDSLAYWVVSDHFEELGRPPRLFHDGFGLLSVGNLRKPRYWAVHLAANQGEQMVRAEISEPNSTIETWASRHLDGLLDILVWNGSINTEIMNGDPRLDRTVRVGIRGLPTASYEVSIARIDQVHSNVVSSLPREVDWPDAAQWETLRADDALFVERADPIVPTDGMAWLEVQVPHPGVVRIRLESNLEPVVGLAP